MIILSSNIKHKIVKTNNTILIGIYKITSPIGKVYIGLSINIYLRWKQHKSLSKYDSQYLLNRSLKKYGVENHIFEIVHVLEFYDKDELNFLEAYYGKLFNVTDKRYGLNIRDCGGNNGKHSQETKEKIRVKATGRFASEETRKKFSVLRKGIKRPPFSETHKKNMQKSKRLLLGKKIIQLDKNGNYIKTWDCINAVDSELNIDNSSIIRVCNDKQITAGGFKWKYEDEKNKLTEPQSKKGRLGELNPNSIKIIQYDLNLKFVRTWISAAEASRELKISSSNISAVCRGKDKTYKGYIWHYFNK